MTGKDVIKELMEQAEVTNAQLAKRLDVTQAVVWARLNNKSARDMQLAVFDEMLNALGYEMVIRKRRGPEEADEGFAVRIDPEDVPYKKGRPRKEDAASEKVVEEEG